MSVAKRPAYESLGSECSQLLFLPVVVESATLSKIPGPAGGSKIDQLTKVTFVHVATYNGEGTSRYYQSSLENAIDFQKRKLPKLDTSADHVYDLNVETDDNVSTFLEDVNKAVRNKTVECFQARLNERYGRLPKQMQTFRPKIVDIVSDFSNPKPRVASDVIDMLSGFEKEVKDYVAQWKDCTFSGGTENKEGEIIPIGKKILPSINGSPKKITEENTKKDGHSGWIESYVNFGRAHIRGSSSRVTK